MISLVAAALLLIAPWAGAQTLTTVNENLATSSSTMLVDTNSNRLDVGTAAYTGSVPGAVLFVGSNVVVGTGTGASSEVVIYATGTIMLKGHQVSTIDPTGLYVPYTGATGDVTLGTHKMLAAQFGAGTSPSTNFLFDGLGSVSAFARVTAAANQAAGYYWGGTRGYSMQQRYDLTGTPFTLHDELNNVDRFYLDTSGAWYFPIGVTFSSGTSLGAFKAASFLGVSGATETVDATMGGAGTVAAPLGVNFSTITTALALKAPLASPTFTGTVNGAAGVFSGTFTAGGFASAGSIIASSGVFTAAGLLQNSIVTSSGIIANAGDICAGTKCLSSAGTGATGPAGPAGSPAGTLGYLRDNFLGLANGVTKTFTLSNAPSKNSEQVYLDGLLMSSASDYTLAGTALTITTAPATACTAANASNCTYSFFVQYATGATGVNAFILNSSQTVSGATVFSSSVTVGPVVYTTTANYSAVIRGGWSMVAASTSYGVGGLSFTGLDIRFEHRMTCKGVQFGASTQPFFKFDGSATTYQWLGYYICQGIGVVAYGAPGSPNLPFTPPSTPTAGTGLKFTTQWSNAKDSSTSGTITQMNTVSTFSNAASNTALCHSDTSQFYANGGVGNGNRLDFLMGPSATWAGYCWIEVLTPSVNPL